ncbi:6-carboxytetrahydropterin synthase [Gammaproteobacteria bacterium]|jgi:6-pyruvoyltetrahydropterin/6-carboxytetrahydropterin synthase|nr:6-carboxytetrahydropterin synthase [Gammaproteobacteria bacterium]MDC0985356.1 6-carboxytetrahydropterin synthase [Gammaproteobacteria bacterium]
MYELKIRDYCFIAHSLKDEFFGPAKNLHGVTYVVDLLISSKELIEKNVIIDIGLANKILKSVISQYNYKNLDDMDKFNNHITTTEYMAKQFVDDICIELEKIKYPLKELNSIKIELKENHIASASYIKNI